MEPNVPDWLDEIEDTITPNAPELELLNIIKEFPALYDTYTFPELFFKEQVPLSRNASILANLLIKERATIEDLLLRAMKKGLDMETLSKHLTWKLFEHLVSSYLEHSGWNSVRGYRFKALESKRTNHEVDVIAWNQSSRIVLFIDCKRYKSTGASPICKAAEQQGERCLRFKEILPDIWYDDKLPWIQSEHAIRIIPIIVTWHDHGTKSCTFEGSKIGVVPISLFSDFVRNASNALEEYFHVEWSIV